MNDLAKNLKIAIFSVMEQMFFTLPDEVTIFDPEPELDVYIGISGSPNYIVSLVFDSELAAAMVTNLLGVEGEELDFDMIKKNLSEAANIIGGRFLLDFGDESDRNVTIPSFSHDNLFPGENVVGSSEFTISFEKRPVKVLLEEVK